MPIYSEFIKIVYILTIKEKNIFGIWISAINLIACFGQNWFEIWKFILESRQIANFNLRDVYII